MGNVTQVASNYLWLPNSGFSETFTYDASDQLTSATEQQHYQLSVTYGNWGKVNTYDLTQTDLLQNTTTQNAYTLTYPSNSNGLQQAQTPFAPSMQYGGTGGVQAAVAQYTFGINGSLRKKVHFTNNNPVEYYLFNSAANLKAYSYDKTDFAYYGYNAANTRTYKLSMLNQNQWVNGHPQPLNLQLQSAMFYPNAYINFNHNGEYTKHYYNGTERIASRLGNATLNITTTANSRLTSRTTHADNRFQTDVQDLVDEDIPLNNAGQAAGYTPIPLTSLAVTGTSSNIFYYHTNHLGSTAYVTDQNQNVTQGFLYAPFGEITTEYNANFGNDIIPKYSFDAKELDEETGMYYYEARYYKPPVFTSRDAMFEKYFWMTPYAYCANNPVKYVDPSGRIIDPSDLNSEQRKKWETAMKNACENSKLFKALYDKLDKSKTVYKIRIGKTQNNAPGQYNDLDNSITFRNEEMLINPSAYIEEMFHAYQNSENKDLYQKGISFNYEFEAKLAKYFIMIQLDASLPSGSFQNMPFLDKILEYTNYCKHMPSTTFLMNPIVQKLYEKEANLYSELNKKTNHGNGNYKVSNKQKPASLIKIFKDAGY